LDIEIRGEHTPACGIDTLSSCTDRELLQRSLENAVEPTGQLLTRSTAMDRVPVDAGSQNAER
jgi:hypothetical protein